MTQAWRVLLIERNTTLVATPGVDGAARIAITFDFWRDTDERALPKAYGESFFAKRDIPQLHVFAHWNHWYQVEEMDRILDAISESAAGAQTRIGYGSSMGGFATLAFAQRLGTDIAIAITPQFSIDPRKGWDEARFRESAYAIMAYHSSSAPDALADPFHYEIIDQAQLPERTYLVYDPDCGPDVAHIDAIREHHDVTPIHCRNGGHWPDLAFRNAGLLSQVVESAIEGMSELPAFYDLRDPIAEA